MNKIVSILVFLTLGFNVPIFCQDLKDDVISENEVIQSLNIISTKNEWLRNYKIKDKESYDLNASMFETSYKSNLEYIAWLIIYSGENFIGSDEIDNTFQMIKEQCGSERVHYAINVKEKTHDLASSMSKMAIDLHLYRGSSHPSPNEPVMIDTLLSKAAFQIQEKGEFIFKVYSPKRYVRF